MCCELPGMPLWVEMPAALNAILRLGATFAGLAAVNLGEEESLAGTNEVLYRLWPRWPDTVL